MCAAMNARSIELLHNSTCSMPWKQRNVGAGLDRQMQIGGFRGRGASRVDDDDLDRRIGAPAPPGCGRNRTGCAQAAFEPAMNRSASVRCPRSRRAVRRRPASALYADTALDMHSRELVSMLLVPIRPLRELVEDVVVLGQQLAGDVEAQRCPGRARGCRGRNDRR